MVRFDPAHQAVRDVGRVAFGAAAFAEVAGGVDGAAVVHARGAVVLGGAGAGGFAVAVEELVLRREGGWGMVGECGSGYLHLLQAVAVVGA